MISYEIIQTLWFIIIGVIFIGFSVLDGFDLGIGSLFPFLAENENDKGKLFNIIGPVWDGNEVWLLLAGGALFAAFPDVYATVFSGFYLAFILILFGLILRAVSIEFWFLDKEFKKIWERAFFLGSLIPSILTGIALGNVICGIPLNEKMEFTGSFFTLLRPYPLVIGVLGFASILMQGCAYAALKAEDKLLDKTRQIMKKIWYFSMSAYVISVIFTVVFMPGNFSRPLAWVFASIYIFSMVIIKIFLEKQRDSMLFKLASLSFISLWGIAGAVQFPVLVRDAVDQKLNLTIYNSSSSELSLTIMLIMALIGMPLVIFYQTYIYRIFKKKINMN